MQDARCRMQRPVASCIFDREQCALPQVSATSLPVYADRRQERLASGDDPCFAVWGTGVAIPCCAGGKAVSVLWIDVELEDRGAQLRVVAGVEASMILQGMIVIRPGRASRGHNACDPLEGPGRTWRAPAVKQCPCLSRSHHLPPAFPDRCGWFHAERLNAADPAAVREMVAATGPWQRQALVRLEQG